MTKTINSCNLPVLHTDPLVTKFDKLSADCLAAFDAELDAKERIANKLACAYMLFKELRDKPAVFANIYEREGYAPPDLTAAVPDFATYVKALFRIDPRQPNDDDRRRTATHGAQVLRNRVSGYVASLKRMHGEYKASPGKYRRNADAKLAQFHIEAGGVEGARQAQAAQNQAAKNASAGVVANNAPDPSAISASWLGNHGLSILKKSPINAGNLVIQPGKLDFVTDECTLCIVFDDGNGQLRCIQAANDNDVLQSVARSTAGRPRYIEGLALRTLVEVVSTQRYPIKFAPKGSRLNVDGAFGTWYRGVYLEKGKSGQPAPRRLVVRRDSILLSATDSDAGVTTILRPKQNLLPQGMPDAHLEDLDLRRLEHWLDANITASFTCNPLDLLGVRPNTPGCYLTINSLASQISPIDFDLADTTTRNTDQVEFDDAKFVADWSFSAGKHWFLRLRNDFLVKWFKAHASGNKLKREAHLAFKLDVHPSQLRVGFELDATGNHPWHDADLDVDGASRAHMKGSMPYVHVSTKDIAPVLHNIPDIDLVSDVTVSGNADLVLLEFGTEIGAYRIAVPTVKVTAGNLARSPRHMKQW